MYFVCLFVFDELNESLTNHLHIGAHYFWRSLPHVHQKEFFHCQALSPIAVKVWHTGLSFSIRGKKRGSDTGEQQKRERGREKEEENERKESRDKDTHSHGGI